MFNNLFIILYDLGLWILKAYFTFRLMKFLYIILLSIYAHFFSKELDLSVYKDYWTGKLIFFSNL